MGQDLAWYVDNGDGSTTGYWGVTAWASSTAKSAGDRVRQTAPAYGSERVFICVVAGTTNSTEPSWTTTRGGSTTDNTVTWREITGHPAMNGDSTNVQTFAQANALGAARHLGQIVKNGAADRYFLCTVSGNGNGTEPSWNSATAGQTFAEGPVTWTCLGLISAFSTGWAAPHATTETPNTAFWIGTNYNAPIYVATSHRISRAAAVTYNPNSASATSSVKVLVVDKNNVPPTTANKSTGAQIKTTGANSITLGGIASGISYLEGIDFYAGDGANSASITLHSGHVHKLKRSKLTLGGNAGSINIGTTSRRYTSLLEDISLEFANASGASCTVTLTADLFIRGGSLLAGSVIPTTLFTPAQGDLNLSGFDLSLAGSGKTIIGAPSGNNNIRAVLSNCKLDSAATFVGTIGYGYPNSEVYLINCDVGSLANYNAKYDRSGTMTTVTDNVRTGGAEEDGVARSRKIITNANAVYACPFIDIPMVVFIDTAGVSKTVTVYASASAIPLDSEMWMEVEYLGNSGDALSTITETCAGAPYGGTTNSSDASTWTAGTAFKMAKTFTPNRVGFFSVRVKVAKASLTVNYDPVPVVV